MLKLECLVFRHLGMHEAVPPDVREGLDAVTVGRIQGGKVGGATRVGIGFEKDFRGQKTAAPLKDWQSRPY